MSIKLEHINFSYENKPILMNINLTVKSGEHIVITGASGGGKSTLLKLISGLYSVQSGYIEVAGEINPSKIRQHTALVMQNPMLLPVSIGDNITCGHSIDDIIITQACKVAQLLEWIKTLPNGIDSSVGDRGNKISGGQAQRIAIARAIAKILTLSSANQTAILLLDEATSALDFNTSKEIFLNLENLLVNITLISITHQSETLINYHHIYRLEGGIIYDT